MYNTSERESATCSVRFQVCILFFPHVSFTQGPFYSDVDILQVSKWSYLFVLPKADREHKGYQCSHKHRGLACRRDARSKSGRSICVGYHYFHVSTLHRGWVGHRVDNIDDMKRYAQRVLLKECTYISSLLLI